MRVALPPPPWIRAACLLAFAAFLVQLFILDEPALAERMVNLTWDKFMHALAFGGVAAILWTGLGCGAPLVTWVLVSLTGAVDELNQLFVPGRHADALDVLADTIGAGIAVFALQRLALRRRSSTAAGNLARSVTVE
jgi:VanZ family protein